MNKDFILNTFKSNYNKGTWSQDYIMTMANNYFNRGVLEQSDLDSLEEFFNPSEMEEG